MFTDLGEIAWILNLRSGEIPYNPFFKAVVVVAENEGTLFLPESHPSMNSEEVLKHLQRVNFTIKPYNPTFPRKVLCRVSQLNHHIFSSI